MGEGNRADALAAVQWAGSGAMSLTGDPHGPPLVEPAPVAAAMVEWSKRLAVATASWGERVDVDGPALLGERAAIHGFGRGGAESVGGAARFVRAADGWVVLNLPRPEDVAALPALLETEMDPGDWATAAARISATPADIIVERGSVLGLAVAYAGEQSVDPAVMDFRCGGARRPSARPLVVDLSSLWAGPLLTSLLSQAGARVVKVESRGRPDGARRGNKEFFDLLNAGKESLLVDLGDRDDVRLLRLLIAAADLVVESSRPRAMTNLGVVPGRYVDSGVSWLSITGHGRQRAKAMRIGFGDDAAVAGGLWVRGDPPMFVADAVADPMTGLVGAVRAAELLGSDTASGVDLALSRVAGEVAPIGGFANRAAEPVVAVDGADWLVEVAGERVPVARPGHRHPFGHAEKPGDHDHALRVEFGHEQLA